MPRTPTHALAPCSIEREKLIARLESERAPALVAALERRLLELALQLGDASDSDARARALLDQTREVDCALGERTRARARGRARTPPAGARAPARRCLGLRRTRSRPARSNARS